MLQETDIALDLGVAEQPGKASASRAKYLKPYSDYVPIYGKAVRTIKWWKGEGEKATHGPDLPPLDNPVEMPVWWDRVMKQRCPQTVIDAARAASSSAPAPSSPPPSSLGASSPPPAPMHYQSAVLTTTEQNLQHLQEQLARVRRELLEMQSNPDSDPLSIEAKERKWRELRLEVDKAEESAFKMRSKQGKLVDIEQFASELLPKLVAVATSVRFLITRLHPRLAKAATPAEADTIWQAGVDECFEGLIEDGFVKREQLNLAA